MIADGGANAFHFVRSYTMLDTSLPEASGLVQVTSLGEDAILQK